MNRLSAFSSPLLLGFDHFEQLLDRVAKSANDGYPPYNIERVATNGQSNGLRITLAVAGFARDDLQISAEDNQLIIRGRQAEEAERVYVHRGIAARQFQRSFVLAEGIEISGASLDNGLLHIDLIRPQPEVVTRNIEIAAGPPNGGPSANGKLSVSTTPNKAQEG
ncbi:MAG: Hsp20 family protein [Rhodospirillaceae bacterium]|jgi:HSP20 family molecular chaperone IbpA|nr:Hsp20 family protein [Rhodospirillaceae bacterium]MBT4043987.1 Hsp20 family protein [Rhodospirillaceae bacterium]MBT4689703.1 Hsp20 family protein [Rhodospirillaceae bacterium]MBT5079050.1 Hsp20 family protein [Rhodospirillaceae bacterium]MBT5523149.1 Hsp20 family protein [Rhodospirillaceae bacterium]